MELEVEIKLKNGAMLLMGVAVGMAVGFALWGSERGGRLLGAGRDGLARMRSQLAG